jgi:2-methylisocitrate lyase-like PEP mutase family enzyme
MARSRAARLQELIHRRDKVLAVLHPPSAAHARIMEQAGCEALFVGTGGVVGAYTGLADVGTATMTECVTIAGWIADSVRIPVMIDGDTGHGGIMAVRRLVRESIRVGLAGIRIDDQPIEGKRKTQNAGIDVVPLEQAIARYRAAVDMKNELDPDFVVMAQCYARDAAGGDARRHDRPHEGLSRTGRGRLGAVRIAALDRRNQGGAGRDRRPVFVHARQARALSRPR